MAAPRALEFNRVMVPRDAGAAISWGLDGLLLGSDGRMLADYRFIKPTLFA